MSELKPGESWWFEFVALPDDRVPEAIRYRRLLKYALRTLGLRCKRCSGKGPESHQPTNSKGE